MLGGGLGLGGHRVVGHHVVIVHMVSVSVVLVAERLVGGGGVFGWRWRVSKAVLPGGRT